MSLITRCPACATMFKVVPDQLRISEGWVRCGQCDEVFDANAHLHSEWAVEDTTDSTADAQESEPLSHQSVTDSPGTGHDDGAFQSVDLADPMDTLHHDPFLEKSPQELSRFLGHDNLQADDTLNLAPGGWQSDSAALVPEPVEPRYLQSEVPLHAVALDPTLSFMRSAAVQASGHRLWVRWALWGACLFLCGSLVLQVAIRDRDRIAAAEPATRPWLESLCDLFACKISPLRQIESVVIDSSSFAKVRSDVYRLNFTIKNTASSEVATPSLELTLTDLQDQPVIRKVFGVNDFGMRQAALVPGSELAVSLPVSVRLTGVAERVSGYRLMVFYP